MYAGAVQHQLIRAQRGIKLFHAIRVRMAGTAELRNALPLDGELSWCSFTLTSLGDDAGMADFAIHSFLSMSVSGKFFGNGVQAGLLPSIAVWASLRLADGGRHRQQ